MTTQHTGAWAEGVAAGWLRGEGFEVWHTNWRHASWELDIVARKGDVLHFVEVKARRRGSLTLPEDAITPLKFRSLQRAAGYYIAKYRVDLEIQFDLVAVEFWSGGHELRYIPNAMLPRW